MGAIKVLPLPDCFTLKNNRFWEPCIKNCPKISPVFNRDGYYYNRLTKKTWLEIKGEAWEYLTPQDFLYTLSLSEGDRVLNKEVIAALKTLIANNLATNEQILLFNRECDKESCRKANIAGQKVKKRFREFVQKIENRKL